MLIWSVVPTEYLFEGMDKMECNWMEAEVGGVKMLVEPEPDRIGYGKIVRLLSPDPSVYLNPGYQPGMSVCLLNGK
ncbi:MAG: YlzJ-like family protein [Tumebacillaceae bacterium]